MRRTRRQRSRRRRNPASSAQSRAENPFSENPGLEPNPSGATVGAIAVGLVVLGGIWLLTRKKEEPAKPGIVVPPPGVFDICNVDTATFAQWGVQKQVFALHLFTLDAPPDLATLTSVYANLPGLDETKVVVAMKNGAFYRYQNGKPVQAPELRKEYCAWAAQPKLPAPPGSLPTRTFQLAGYSPTFL